MQALLFILLLGMPALAIAQPRVVVEPFGFNFDVPGPVVRDGAQITLFNEGDEALQWTAELEIVSEPEGVPVRDNPGELLGTFRWNRVGARELKPGVAVEPESRNLILASSNPAYIAIIEHDDSYRFTRILTEWELGVAPRSITYLNGVIYVVTAGHNYLLRYDLEGNELERLNLQFVPRSVTCSPEENWLILLTDQLNHINFLDEQGEQFGWIENILRQLQDPGSVVWVDRHEDSPLWITNGWNIYNLAPDLPAHSVSLAGSFRIPRVRQPNPADGMGHDGRSLVIGCFDQEEYMAIDDGLTERGWIRIAPTSGVVAAGDSQIVLVLFDFSGLTEGEYAADVHFMSNDPENGDVVVEISIDLTPGADIDVSWPRIAGYPYRVNYHLLYLRGIFPGDTCRAVVDVWNFGTETLYLDELEPVGEGYFCRNDSTYLMSGRGLPVEIFFSGAETGTYDGQLIFHTDDPDEPEDTIRLQATVDEPPILAIDQQELSFNQPESGDSLYLRLTNRGRYRLIWEAELDWFGGDSLADSLGDVRDEWVRIEPDSGVVFANDTRRVYLKFNDIEEHMPIESGELILTTNDPAHPRVIVPLTLTWLSVEEGQPVLPVQTRLGECYPNPFNSSATIEFALSNACNLSLTLLDLTGRESAIIAAGDYSAGRYQVILEAGNLAAGIYFVRFEAMGMVTIRKVVLAR